MSGNPPPDIRRERRTQPSDSRSRGPYRPVFSPVWGRSISAPPDALHLLYGTYLRSLRNQV